MPQLQAERGRMINVMARALIVHFGGRAADIAEYQAREAQIVSRSTSDTWVLIVRSIETLLDRQSRSATAEDISSTDPASHD